MAKNDCRTTVATVAPLMRADACVSRFPPYRGSDCRTDAPADFATASVDLTDWRATVALGWAEDRGLIGVAESRRPHPKGGSQSVKPLPLALSDDQLAIVLAGARSVPLDQRGRYLNAISDALMREQRASDAEVVRAVARAQFRFGVQR